MKTIHIGMMGCGNIGCGVYALLEQMAGDIAHRQGLDIRINKILVRDIHKKREANIPRELLTSDPDALLGDQEIQFVIECLGGEEPATRLMAEALRRGKTVITANKMALALNWHVLDEAARQGGAGFFYEASVCGAIPVIRVLNDSLQANRVSQVMGIVNGTTNYILTTMTETQRPYEEVLREAQALGLAEPDPKSDVDGLDAAYKLSVLTSLAFHARIPFDHIYTEGIRGIRVEDIAFGRDLGYRLKLLAVGKREGDQVDVRVHPAFVPQRHPLAAVDGAFNAVFLNGHASGNMMLYGRGAGSLPTAGAMVSDLLFAISRPEPRHPTFENTPNLHPDLQVTDNWRCGYYIRFSAKNRPGVLGHIATTLGQNGVSIQSLLQRKAESDEGVPIIVITHRAAEKDVRTAIAQVDTHIAQVQSAIRVEGMDVLP